MPNRVLQRFAPWAAPEPLPAVSQWPSLEETSQALWRTRTPTPWLPWRIPEWWNGGASWEQRFPAPLSCSEVVFALSATCLETPGTALRFSNLSPRRVPSAPWVHGGMVEDRPVVVAVSTAHNATVDRRPRTSTSPTGRRSAGGLRSAAASIRTGGSGRRASSSVARCARRC